MKISFGIIMCAVGLAWNAAAGAATFHVAPGGTPAGDGSAARPWDLQTALAHPAPVKPGDTILLHGGTYPGVFNSKLKGESDRPITLKQAPGERATIDCLPPKDKPAQACHFTVAGAHAVYQGFEVMSSLPGRGTKLTGSHPGDINRGGINCSGSHIKFINLVVHDTSQGFGFWSNGEGGEIYGCLIYYNGWAAPDRGHGHAIYTQNKTGIKRLEENIMFAQFSYGIHAYGSKAASLVGYHIQGNVGFLNGAPAGPTARTPAILVGGGSPAADIKVIENFTWSDRNHTTVQLGYSAPNKDLVCRDNYIVGGLSIQKWEQPRSENNRVVSRPNVPAEAQVFVRPNRYERGRGHVIVYNWPRKGSVSVDLKGVLEPGQRFRIVSAPDFFGKPVLAGAFDGKAIELPMAPVETARPVGMPDYSLPATMPEFGAFVVLAEGQ